MHRSPLEIDNVKEYERIASFGGAMLMKDLQGRLSIFGGTEDERARAIDWAEMFLNQQKTMTWQ